MTYNELRFLSAITSSTLGSGDVGACKKSIDLLSDLSPEELKQYNEINTITHKQQLNGLRQQIIILQLGGENDI